MSALQSTDLAVPAADGNSSEIDVSIARKMSLYLSGTFVANVQFQVSPFATGSIWLDVGASQSAPGIVEVTAAARRVRAVVSGFTSGTPVGTAVFG